MATLGITDQLNSQNTQSCAFGYDDLGRSATANCGTIWNQTFSFDPFGNISKSANPGITFLPTYNEATNRYTSVPGCTPTYQANGDVTNDCSHTYLTNNSGNLTKIDTLVLVYDALGRMVEQNNSGVYTQIVYSPTGAKYALMNGATLKNAFVGLPGGGTAVYNSSGLAYYRRADWLGSSRLATHTTQSSQASYYYDAAYAPYGENYAGAGTTDLNFTGQNQDTAVGLFEFLYREYNSPQGRWAGPDPAGLEAVNMSNPQSWNRYAYVGNSPLNAVDPLGLHDPNELATYNDDFANPNAVTYYLDGMQVSARVAQNWLSVGAAAQCPKNDCTNITLQSNGEFYKKEYSNPVNFQCNGESSESCYPTHWISVYLGKAGDSLPASILCVHMGGRCDVPVSAGGQQLFQGNRNLWKSANGTMIDLTEAYAAVPLIVAAPEVAVTAAATAETYGVPVFAISLWVQQNWNTLMNARKIWNWYEQCQTKDIC